MENKNNLKNSNRLEDHDPKDFITAYHQANNLDEFAKIRSKLKSIDSGRWYKILEAAHTHLIHSDIQAISNLKVIYKQDFKTWIGVYWLVEDLHTVEEFTGVFR